MFGKRLSNPPADDSEALKLIQAVIAGKKTPEEGAAQIIKYWFPVELFKSNHAKSLWLTRQDSLHEMDTLATELHNRGQTAGARRLAEMNWILAQRSDDASLMAQCAATLAQLLVGDPAAAEQRLALLEFCVPEVITWDHVDQHGKAVMLAHLADARYMTSGADPVRKRRTVQSIEQALALETYLEEEWQAHLYRAAGLLYDELAETEVDLRRSIECNQKALAFFRRETHPEDYASVLNNLGNSYRDLGERTGDSQLLEQALRCYDQALPLRTDPRLALRTKGNRDRALKSLTELQQGHRVPQPELDRHTLSQAENLARHGDDLYFAAQKQGTDRDKQLQGAATCYLEASKLLGRAAPARTRAEILHRLAALFITSTDDDELWTGFCFANATRRLAQGWRPGSLASVDFHKGMALVKIGYPQQEQYLRPAETLLRQALPILKTQGRPGEYDGARKFLDMCQGLLDGSLLRKLSTD